MAGSSSASGPNGATPAPFAIEIKHEGPLLLVSIAGEFDLGATQEFAQVMGELAAEGLREVEIDLRPVAFIDSSGLRMLVHVEQAARERGLTLRIVRGGSAVERVLQVTGLDKILPLVER